MGLTQGEQDCADVVAINRRRRLAIESQVQRKFLILHQNADTRLECVDLMPPLGEVEQQSMLRLGDDLQHIDQVGRQISAVQWILRVRECFVVTILVVGDGRRQCQARIRSQHLSKVQREKVASGSAVAVVERVRVLEDEVRDHCPDQSWNRVVAPLAQHEGQRVVDR